MAVQILAGYWNLDLKSQELLLCPRSRQMLGIDGDSPKKLGKQDWLPRIHPDDIPLIEGELENSERRNEIYAARFRAVRPDGSLCQILGVGRPAARDRTRFVGLNFDLVATAATADLEFRRPGGTVARYAKSLMVRPRPANENETRQRPPGSPLREKSLGWGERVKKDARRQMLLERALATMKMRQLRQKLLDPAVFGEPAFDMLLALYVTNATYGILNENLKAQAARIDIIHEELGQRLTAISLAVGAIEAHGETAGAVTLIRTAVEEARHELRLHRHQVRQEVLS